LWLYLPYVLLLLLLAAVAGDWAWTRSDVLARLSDLRRLDAHRGWSLSYDAARLNGFPFRLDLDLTNPRLAEPSGWAVLAPHLKAEAYLFAPTKWVAVAPDGVVVIRRDAGALIVKGQALRASLSDAGAHPPRLSVEGLNLTFATPPGARPFGLIAAKEFHLHTRAGPRDQGAIYLGVEGGQAAPTETLGLIAAGGPVTFTLDGVFSHAGAMTGADWPQSLRAWTRAGGGLSVRRLELTAGQAGIVSKAGQLGIGPDGRLTGDLAVGAAQTPRILGLMAARGALTADISHAGGAVASARAGSAKLPLDFEAGRVTLGPVALGPSPRLF
jgi:hypothetical protein